MDGWVILMNWWTKVLISGQILGFMTLSDSLPMFALFAFVFHLFEHQHGAVWGPTLVGLNLQCVRVCVCVCDFDRRPPPSRNSTAEAIKKLATKPQYRKTSQDLAVGQEDLHSQGREFLKTFFLLPSRWFFRYPEPLPPFLCPCLHLAYGEHWSHGGSHQRDLLGRAFG